MLARLGTMSRSAKIGIVAAVYGAAVAAALVAGMLYDARMAAQPYDTSGGMYAAGEALTAAAVFLAVAAVPTLLAVWFLRSHPRAWQALGVGAVIFAAVGLIAVLEPALLHVPDRSIVQLVLSLLWLSQLLGVPLWVLAFAAFALLAPTPASRRLMLGALAIELVIGVCAIVHWFVPRSPI